MSDYFKKNRAEQAPVQNFVVGINVQQGHFSTDAVHQRLKKISSRWKMTPGIINSFEKAHPGQYLNNVN